MVENTVPNLVDIQNYNPHDVRNNNNSEENHKPNLNNSTTGTDLLCHMLANQEKIRPMSDTEREKAENKIRRNMVESSDDTTSRASSTSSSSSRSSSSSKESSEDEKESVGNYVNNNKNTQGHLHSQQYPRGIPSQMNNSQYARTVESFEDQRLKKLDMLRKLGELAEKNIKLSRNYTLDDSLEDMETEYHIHRSIRSKRNAVNLMGNVMMDAIYGLEMVNESYNPFDLKLKGWSEQINADMDGYNDVFGDLYEKYNKPGRTVAPEIKLLLMLTGSAIKFHMTQASFLNNALSRCGARDVLDSDPQLKDRLNAQAAQYAAQNAVKQAESMKKFSDRQHEVASNQMVELENIRKYQEQAAMMNNRINTLQEQLNPHQGTIPAPNMQNGLQLSHIYANQHVSSPTVIPIQYPQNQQTHAQQVAHSEALRQHDIAEQLKEMQGRDTVRFARNMGKKNNETDTHATDASVNMSVMTVDTSNNNADSDTQRPRKGRQRKKYIKINTS